MPICGIITALRGISRRQRNIQNETLELDCNMVQRPNNMAEVPEDSISLIRKVAILQDPKKFPSTLHSHRSCTYELS